MTLKLPARPHFDLTTVHLFIATAELGSVTRAAERLHIAPAAASRRIAELEGQFGLPLFLRRPHGMALTDAGRAMLAHARNITHTVLRMQDDAASFAGGAQGVVRLAAPKSAVLQFVPADIERCAVACPGVSIDLQEMNSLKVQQALTRGTADIGIFESSLGGTVDFPTLPYHADELVLVAPRGHALFAHAPATLDHILSCDVISLGEGSAIVALLERLASESGRLLRMRMRVGGFDSIAALIAQGLGVGVMPKAVARSVAGGSRFLRVEIPEPWAHRRFVLCCRPADSLSPAAVSVADVFARTNFAKPAPPN